MSLSVLDLFSIGLGPSSSHTVGPMRAARRFARELGDGGPLAGTAGVRAEFYGSLAATGVGHGSDTAVVLGLAGRIPRRSAPREAPEVVREVEETGRLPLDGTHDIAFVRERDVVLHQGSSLPGHPNGMRLSALDAEGEVLFAEEYYSVGGGFVVTAAELADPVPDAPETPKPFPFADGDELLQRCAATGLSIAEVMRENERTRHSDAEIDTALLDVWDVMQECVENGCTREQESLPGPLQTKRRAPALRRRLRELEAEGPGLGKHATLAELEWVNLYALAVNEENASGGRVVTAPTNGAAGIIPAVLHYAIRFLHGEADPATVQDKVLEFLLTAGAIGTLFKRNASISGADVGCQGEVGSACSMAAAGLCAVLGGTPTQVENAAEIGLEHNLGLTCDPIAGLVQIPCIERNAIASVKAINAARLALAGDGSHRVSLDQAIRTMRDTGRDMMSKYKETSLGGLAVNVAVNVPEC